MSLTNEEKNVLEKALEAPNLVYDIACFHAKFGLQGPSNPLDLNDMQHQELLNFRSDFMYEELEEWEQAVFPNGETSGSLPSDPEKALDALVDLVYVAIGTAHVLGYDFGEAWRRVHAANMSKVRAERVEDSARGSTFDVVKPDDWVAPDLSDLAQPTPQ